ncbi:hypothetical protein [Serratia sp. NPDC087055]|uniref:hypothetical protein n=1 Tax=Serratia sp. NPDC087055 TaxID=3364516 RepID=UPI00384F56C3
MSIFIGALRTLILAAAVLQFSVIKVTATGPLSYFFAGAFLSLYCWAVLALLDHIKECRNGQ